MSREERYSWGVKVVWHRRCGHWILDDTYGAPIPCWSCHKGRGARKQTFAEAWADYDQSMRELGRAIKVSVQIGIWQILPRRWYKALVRRSILKPYHEIRRRK